MRRLRLQVKVISNGIDTCDLATQCPGDHLPLPPRHSQRTRSPAPNAAMLLTMDRNDREQKITNGTRPKDENLAKIRPLLGGRSTFALPNSDTPINFITDCRYDGEQVASGNVHPRHE